jgi:hypothetical protein
MPIGSIIGGVIARGGLRLPFLIGGGIATLISLLAFRRIIKVGDESAKEVS